MSWDVKAERIAAEATADQLRAQADAVRAQTQREAEQAHEDRRQRRRVAADRRREERRARRAKRRARLGGKVRDHLGMAIPVAAVGSPGVIAWSGQLKFGLHEMHLGALAPLVPVAIEGGVLYAAWMAHQAVAESLSAARYRAMTWGLAGIAAGMNFWHGGSGKVGAMLALASLLSIVQLEATIALRKSRRRKAREGWDVAAIHRALVRRVRYPVLSVQAAGIRAASGVDVEEAWRRAWIDRFGVGPDSSRRERALGRLVLKQQDEDNGLAAASGELTIVGGAIVPVNPPAPKPDRRTEVQILATEMYLQSGIGRFEDLLLSESTGGGLELPGGPTEPTASERFGDRVFPAGGDPDQAAAEGDQAETAPDAAPDGDSGDEQPANSKPKPDAGARRRRWAAGKPAKNGKGSQKPSPKGAKKADGYQKRLKAVRQLLMEDPEARPPDITEQLNIPPASARRLFNEVKSERGEV